MKEGGGGNALCACSEAFRQNGRFVVLHEAREGGELKGAVLPRSAPSGSLGRWLLRLSVARQLGETEARAGPRGGGGGDGAAGGCVGESRAGRPGGPAAAAGLERLGRAGEGGLRSNSGPGKARGSRVRAARVGLGGGTGGRRELCRRTGVQEEIGGGGGGLQTSRPREESGEAWWKEGVSGG